MPVVVDTLRSHLEEHVLYPWLAHSQDTQSGAFYTALDRTWKPYPSNLSLTTQARAIGSLAAAHRVGLGEGRCLCAGQEGAGFLRQHFYDRACGGYFWVVTYDGSPCQKHKRLGSHFALVQAFAALYRAGGDPDSLEAAVEVYNLLETKAYDAEHGGYYEYFAPDWTPHEPRKTLSGHLAALEATLTLASVDPVGAPDYLDRAREIVALLIGPLVDAASGSLLENFTPQWDPLDYHVHYTHLLDAAGFLLDAADRFSLPVYRYNALAWLDHALDIAWDGEHGGFAREGMLQHGVTDPKKYAEVQGRGLAILARVSWFSLRYQSLFRRQLDWCLQHQHDLEHDGWFRICDAAGTPLDLRKNTDVQTEVIHSLVRTIDALQTSEKFI